MLRRPLLRRSAAWFCSLLMLTISVGKAAHVLTEHHNEPEGKYCHAEPGDAHFHSPEYAHHACALCDFMLPLSAEPPVVAWFLSRQALVFEAIASFYRSPIGSSCLLLPSLRGPPAVQTAAA